MQTTQSVSATPERVAQVIFEHAARISREKDISELAQLNADMARDLTGAERCTIWLVEPRSRELWTRVAHGMPELRISQDTGIVGASISQNQTILINDTHSYPGFYAGVDDQSGYRTHSVLCVPLKADHQVIGAIQLLNKPGGFSAEDAELLQLMGLYTASAIQAERLRQEAEAAMLLRRELDVAGEVQRKLLPGDLSYLRGLELAAICRPARMVGGDFYDLLLLPGGRFGLTLGDVSGKGFPAAVMMASIHTLLRTLLLHNPSDLSPVIGELNDVIHASSSADRYSTLFCGVLNETRSELTYVNAGHIPPFIIRAGGQIDRPSEGELPVGLLPGTSYWQHRASVAPGDLIVCISDGFVEAQNTQGELWDGSLLEENLRHSRDLPVEQVLAGLVRAVDDYADGAEQADDMTAVVLRV
jgi:sigma-B regulation protein RsbU (phosphoserine phosphatase)